MNTRENILIITMAIRATIGIAFALLFALSATSCEADRYNPGDPRTREFVEHHLLDCLLDPNCPPTVTVPVPILAETTNNSHTGLVTVDGNVRIWGLNDDGQLGFNNTVTVGDGSGPSIIAAGDVAMGGTAVMITAGTAHTCALLDPGKVRCWGNGVNGGLGYDSTANVGDGIGASITTAGDVPMGANATRIGTGSSFGCALLSTGGVRCWGAGNQGRLGYNNTNNIGDGTTSIIAAGDVPVGGIATDIAVGNSHVCIVLTNGSVRCWGNGNLGRLGYGSTAEVGDGTGLAITAAGDVAVGGTVTRVTTGNQHTCALLSGGTVRCWGNGADGRLGYDGTSNVSDGVGPAITAAGDVPIGGTVVGISAGAGHTCALLDTGAVRCWGLNDRGQLGYGNTANVGDGSGPSIIAAGDIPLGGTAVQVVAGNNHTCAVLDDASVRCWGEGTNGRLGYNAAANIADGVGLSIIEAGDVPFE